MRAYDQPVLVLAAGLVCFVTLKYGVLLAFNDYNGQLSVGNDKVIKYETTSGTHKHRKQYALPGRFGHDHQHSAVFSGASFSYVAFHQKGSPPDASDILTHLKFTQNDTKLQFSKLGDDKIASRTGVLLSIGIAHTQKHESQFLNHTLPSLLTNLALNESKSCLLVILLCDIDWSYNTKAMAFIKSTYWEYISSGLLEVVVPPSNYYPDLEAIAKTADRGPDSFDAFILRCKENLDAAFLMNYMSSRSKYVALFQDIVVFKPGFYTSISRFMDKPPRTNWYFVRFTDKDALTTNVMLRSEDCPKFVNFFIVFYKAWHLELLYEQYLVVWCRRCSRKYYYLRIDFPQQIIKPLAL